MEIEIHLVDGPVAEHQLPPQLPGMTGTWAEFRGIVRGEENGSAIAALEYEAYSPMADNEIRRILEEIASQHPCQFARVIHRIGIVPVGEAAIYIGVAACHRAEAFALLADFMDRLKQAVPIWKCRAIPVTALTAPAVPNSAASASDVQALLWNLCSPLSAERVTLANAAGRVLREPACAPEDQPAFDRSSMDGYAVLDAAQSTQFRIVDEIRAGDWKPRQLQPGETVRIATGGALPGEGLQVVMREDVQVEGKTMTVLRRNEENHIRRRGEDARAGQILVAAGTVLAPGALALLASIGVAQPLVTRLPRVVHLATGNEIVPPEQTPQRGQVRDSNSTLIRAFLAAWHIEPEQVRVPEDEAPARTEIQKLDLKTIDLLLISGGASVGEHDFTRHLLAELGFQIHLSRTATRPGKPLIVAQRGSTLAFGLPGNPLAHFVGLNLYVRTALATFAGSVRQPMFQTGTLATALATDGNTRETFWPARQSGQNGVAMLTPLRWSSSGDLTSLATANALIRVTAGAEKFGRGRRVEFVSTESNA